MPTTKRKPKKRHSTRPWPTCVPEGRHQPTHLMGEVLYGAPPGHRHVTPARQRLTGQEQVADALPPVLVVLPQRNSGPGRQRWPR